MRKTLLICILWLSACTSASNPPGAHDTPEPYLTSPPRSTDTPSVLFADTPLPTTTPFTYVIQAGDTVSELAEMFHISQDDLRAANPDLNPNSMTIGMTILIPNSSATGASTPVPVPVPITQTVCHPSADKGLWCFALIRNDTSDILEGIVVQITLIDENGGVIASQPALLPIDILLPGTSLPAYVFFPTTPATVMPRAQLLSALQVSAGNPRYLPAVLDNTLIQIDGNGRTAQVSGEIHLPADSTAAAHAWVAAVAYDRNGQVVGVRRWEGGGIQPGTSTPFNFVLAGLGSGIEDVELVVQAGP